VFPYYPHKGIPPQQSVVFPNLSGRLIIVVIIDGAFLIVYAFQGLSHL